MALPYPEQVILLQDNSPIHRSRVVDDWFRNHPEVVRLEFPAKSPDFNIIENVWGKMARSWTAGNERTSDALERHAMAV